MAAWGWGKLVGRGQLDVKVGGLDGLEINVGWMGIIFERLVEVAVVLVGGMEFGNGLIKGSCGLSKVLEMVPEWKAITGAGSDTTSFVLWGRVIVSSDRNLESGNKILAKVSLAERGCSKIRNSGNWCQWTGGIRWINESTFYILLTCRRGGVMSCWGTTVSTVLMLSWVVTFGIRLDSWCVSKWSVSRETHTCSIWEFCRSKTPLWWAPICLCEYRFTRGSPDWSIIGLFLFVLWGVKVISISTIQR